MNNGYTTTLTNEARRRGIGVEVVDAATPIFILKHRGRSVRCCRGVTDRVGAVSFQLAQDKHLTNRFLARYGFPVPQQIKFSRVEAARAFLEKHRSVVVKPCREWGGRGVSVAVKTVPELQRAIARARKFGEDIVLEQCVEGIDKRLIIVNGQFLAAMEREPAFVIGNGKSSVRELIRQKNARLRKIEPGAVIPLNAETRRNLTSFGLDYHVKPRKGKKIQVRRTSNVYTSGTVKEITGRVDGELVREAQKIARLFGIPVIGIDVLVNPKTGRHWVIEVCPELSLAPPEGERVARHFLDYLFPGAKAKRKASP